MKNSVVYLTRQCPRQCSYCNIRDVGGIGKVLSPLQWVEAFGILRSLGVEFNLILGNEPWLLGKDLPIIVASIGTPYALYTSCYPPLFERYKHQYFSIDEFTNFSAGVDFPLDRLPVRTAVVDDSYTKSMDAWIAFLWVRSNFPKVETHATVTVHRLNYHLLPRVVDQLSFLGVYININFIHWNSDGGFDFLPVAEEIRHLLFTPADVLEVSEMIVDVLESSPFIQNSEMLEQSFADMALMQWHCEGDPYGGPTVDADGSLRVCGYRKGARTAKFTIFDLPRKLDEWKEAVYLDAMDCPGCSWSCPWMFQYWKRKDPEKGSRVFAYHEK